ncbi:MAG: hypothetical protein H7066_16075, partial [Cytophagaceae bacterium]|nr:hypothetical protein [Gemmatimonadaceae bacterium]
MRSRSSLTLGRLVERVADIAGPRHRELVRGMVSELECIPDRGERRRFALGAIAAILRLSLSDFRDRKVHAPGEYVDLLVPAEGAIPMNPLMPKNDRREILRRHVLPLAITAASLTAILLTNFVVRQLPYLSARGAPSGTIAE